MLSKSTTSESVEIKELATPAHLLREFPCSEKTEELTYTRAGRFTASFTDRRSGTRDHRPVFDA